MGTYEVDDELAFRVDRLARRMKPFEALSFQEGLKRVLDQFAPQTGLADVPEIAQRVAIQNAVEVARAAMKKAPSPSPIQYASMVPELKKRPNLTTWKSITDFLSIETAGDSARRKLAGWVKMNRPDWPPVPVID
jgi:predicted transcriptional regulator